MEMKKLTETKRVYKNITRSFLSDQVLQFAGITTITDMKAKRSKIEN